MAQKIETTAASPGMGEEGEIIITTRAVIGRVRYTRHGNGSPVEIAFGKVGKYLNEQASEGITSEVEFEFLGAKFFASTGPMEDYNAPT